MLEFSIGIVVTTEEYELLAEPIRHVERCMLLTNDYWSWPREREQSSIQEAGKVFNTICTSTGAASHTHQSTSCVNSN